MNKENFTKDMRILPSPDLFVEKLNLTAEEQVNKIKDHIIKHITQSIDGTYNGIHSIEGNIPYETLIVKLGKWANLFGYDLKPSIEKHTYDDNKYCLRVIISLKKSWLSKVKDYIKINISKLLIAPLAIGGIIAITIFNWTGSEEALAFSVAALVGFLVSSITQLVISSNKA